MDLLNNLSKNILTLVPKNNRKHINQDNIIAVLLLITSLYIYNKKPTALIGLLVHPFSQVILVGMVLYCLNNKQSSLAVGIAFIFIVTILINNENKVENILPIEKREHFKDKKEEDSDDDEEEDSDDEDNEEEFEDDDSDDESDDEEEKEKFSGKPKKNLNDTFKNLHDAIHQLETFINTPN